MNAPELLAILVLNCLWCVGIYSVTSPGMLLGHAAKKAARLPYWIKNPLFYCLTCMATVHGLGGYLPMYFMWDLPVIGYMCYIIPLAGLNAIVQSHIDA